MNNTIGTFFQIPIEDENGKHLTSVAVYNQDIACRIATALNTCVYTIKLRRDQDSLYFDELVHSAQVTEILIKAVAAARLLP